MPSTASQTSSGVSPASTSEATRVRGAAFEAKARKSARSAREPLRPWNRHSSPHPELGVASDLAFVGVRDLDLHHEIGSGAFHVSIGRAFALDEGVAVAPGTLAEIESRVGLHSGAGRLARPSQASVAKPLRCASESAPCLVHDAAEELGQILVKAGRRHQDNEAAYRVEADATEVPVPVDGGKGGDGAGVGVKDVDGRAERPDLHGGGVVHGNTPPV